jgi:hypothetical protein
MMTYILRRLNFIVVFAIFCGHATAETLCKQEEIVYFSCLTSTGKIISLCGNSMADTENFWLQYRFGKSSRIELEYPKKRTNLFAESGFDVGYYRRSNGFDTEVSFTTNGWSYTVFNWVGGEEDHSGSTGVFVAKQRSGPGTTLACKDMLTFGKNNIFFSFASQYDQSNE